MLGSPEERKTGRKRDCRQRELGLTNSEEGTTLSRLRKKAISTYQLSITPPAPQIIPYRHPQSSLSPCPPSPPVIDIIQLMTKKLSQAFFGDKKFTEKVYGQLVTSGDVQRADIEMIFEPYTSKLQAIDNGELALLDLFVEFVQGAIHHFRTWPFQKLSSVVEIAAHVFEHSFEHWLSREQSFKYFSDVLVRHSLFRPPHSVCIFNYEELNQITAWWLAHFDRYFAEYQQCMASALNQLLITSPLPSDSHEQSLAEGRVVDKGEIARFLQ